jgi:plasmid segregation protein ParM
MTVDRLSRGDGNAPMAALESETTLAAAASMTDVGTPAIVAVDDGYAQTKVMFGPAEEECLVIPTLIEQGFEGFAAFGEDVGGRRSGQRSGWYQTEGVHRFTVAPHLAGMDTRLDGWHWSKPSRVMTHHALRMAGFAGRSVRLVCGLPVQQFYRNGLKNDEALARKSENLKVAVTSVQGDSSQEVTVLDVNVCSQAVVTWVDWLFDMETLDVHSSLDEDAAVGVVDIGGRTTDIAVVRNFEVDHARSGSDNLGVLDVREHVARALCRRFDLQVGDIPAKALEGALRTGVIALWGQSQDCRAEVHEAVQSISDQLAMTIERRIGRAVDLDALLFVGGGMHIFSTLAQRYPNSVIMERPEFSNVRGMYKIGLIQFGI